MTFVFDPARMDEFRPQLEARRTLAVSGTCSHCSARPIVVQGRGQQATGRRWVAFASCLPCVWDAMRSHGIVPDQKRPRLLVATP